jgi:hypothetical protein
MSGSEGNVGLSTRPPDDGANGLETGLRRVSISFVALLIVLGMVGMLGVRDTTAEASANGLTIGVSHASVTRAGLATTFGIEVSTTDDTPLPPIITTRISSRYLDMLDENGLDPDPTVSFRDSDWTWWTFEVPTGAREFEVSFDARLEPSVQWGRRAVVAIETEGTSMVDVEISTWVMP